MSGYNAKNYTEQGGEKTVIGGTLEFTDEAKVTNIPGIIDNQIASTASTVAGAVADFNALLTKLKTSGLMKADE